MRLLVDVRARTDGWAVQITLPDGTELDERGMQRLDEAPFVGPLEPDDPTAPHASLIGDSGRGARRDLIRLIGQRQVDENDLVRYGRYLFESLIGRAAWERMRTVCDRGSTLEVALRWPSDESDLHTPLWEAMHDGEHFLSVYGGCAVAITRVVADATAGAEALETAPRVLFAIGSDLTDQRIRPGAEFMGVLRAVRTTGSPMTPFVLQQASLRSLSQTVARFRPDAVHFICHGQLAQRRPRLLLRPAEPQAGVTEVPVGPDEVFASLTPPGSTGPPRIVVLSACETGAGGLAERAGGESVTPFAVGLVQKGVPVVVAMSGRVTDTACRLFSRRFAEALTRGEELVSAVASGRRAAYMETHTPSTIDWLLPAVFLASGVKPGFTPLHRNAGDVLRERLHAYDLDWSPVFCGGQAFFEAYDKLVDPAERLSTIFVYWDQRGVGKDRLPRELAARALADGHIPIMVMQSDAWPRTPVQLGAAFGIAIEAARERFGLPPGASSLLALASDLVQDPPSVPTTRPGLQAVFARLKKPENQAHFEIIEGGVAGAIKEDIGRLIDDARVTGRVPASGSAFVVLGDVDQWDKARDTLLDGLLGNSGLLIGGRKVPVVATWKNGDAAGESLSTELNQRQGQLWNDFLPLAPLKDEEELLAYQWVLMHPREQDHRKDARKVWVVREPDKGAWREEYRSYIGGLPRRFEEDIFLLLARLMTAQQEFAVGDDELVLQKYLNGQNGDD